MLESNFIARIRKLLADLDVDNRLYALVQIELIAGSGAPEAAELEQLLEAARTDRSPDVAARAVRMCARLAKARHAALLDRLSAGPLGEPARRAAPGHHAGRDGAGRDGLAAPEGFPDPERIRAGIARRFAPWLERACEHLREHAREDGASPHAVAALGAFAWPGAIAALEAAAVQAPLRAAALAALRDIGSEEAQAALRRLATQGETRIAALEELGQAGLAAIPAELTAALAGSPDERRAGVRGLAALTGDAAVAAGPVLLAALDDPEPSVVVEAVKGLGQTADPASAPALARAAQSRDSRVRATVASALTRIVVQPAESTLRALCRDVDARVRANAVDAIVCFHPDRATMRRFYAGLLRDDHHRVRSNALVILWPFNSKVAYQTLLELINSEVVVERSSGYWAAGKLAEEAAVRAMVRRLTTEDDQRAVEQALVALEAIGRKDLMAPVRKLTSAPWPRIRLRACRVLATVGDPGAVSELKRLCTSETDPKVLWAALRALARLAPAEAMPLLAGADADASTVCGCAIAEGLGDAAGPDVVPHVAALLDHPAPAARARAIAAAVLSGELAELARLDALHAASPGDAFEALALMGRRLGPAALLEAPGLAAALAAS